MASPPAPPDPFGTAALRASVLEAWAASPTRFREDANAEEDLRLGGYAQTWFVELAQNAADAARAAGVPGRLRLTSDASPAAARAGGPVELRVANTGAPLDAGGVAALASLRASAKRDDAAVGRFGVGFAAVLALTDAPRVVSATGGVRFSATDTAAAVAALPGPAAELARRDGQLPVLRLVWPVARAEPPVPDGFATEVRLPLRRGADVEALLAAARATAPDLLLALPDLAEVAVDGRVVRRTPESVSLPGDGAVAELVTVDGAPDGPRRWLLARRGGRLDGPSGAVEERRDWAVAWALPLDAAGRPAPLAADVLHAPTPAAERLSLPARLLATFPLDPDRRHVRAGPVTDRLVDEAARAYLDLLRALPPDDRVAAVPEPGFPLSELGGRLRDALAAALRTAEWLPGAAGAELAPARAERLDVPGAGGLPALLAGADPAFARLLAPPSGPLSGSGAAALAGLGVRAVGAAELAERLLGLDRPAAWWRAVYAELVGPADAVPGLLDELRALPVRLLDGRTVPGPATVLLP
ncbi:MAG TPA: ATP-binding protein, partial [Pseudonocardia sp.]|nr:ATP-binding protein [Pseudonocardia sp.]